MKDFTSSIRQMNVRRVGGILPMRHHIAIAIHGEQLLRAIFIRLRTLALAVTSHLRLMKAGDHLLIREIVEVFEDQKTSHQADRFGAPTDAGIAARKEIR